MNWMHSMHNMIRRRGLSVNSTTGEREHMGVSVLAHVPARARWERLGGLGHLMYAAVESGSRGGHVQLDRAGGPCTLYYPQIGPETTTEPRMECR
jgi:hypothetical protein